MQGLYPFLKHSDPYPMICAYEVKGVGFHKDYIKVGYSERDVEKCINKSSNIVNFKHKNLV